MRRNRRMLVCADGVLVPTLARRCASLTHGDSGRARAEALGRLTQLENELLIGVIQSSAFREAAAEVLNVSRNSVDCLMRARLAPAPDVVRVLYRASRRFDIVCVVLEAADPALPVCTAVRSVFRALGLEIPCTPLTVLGLPDPHEAVVRKLIDEHGLGLGPHVLVDSHPFRTGACLRLGVDSVLFVDAKRLERELELRNQAFRLWP